MDFVESGLRWILLQLLKNAPVPRHVGIVMDGNRRWARRNSQPLDQGHSSGFNALGPILDMSFSAGVKEVTIFAFSIENFRRPQNEVDHLMDIARGKLQTIADQGEVAEKYGVQVKILGATSMLPPDIQETCAELIRRTSMHKNFVLNICVPYTARDDIAHAIRDLAAGHQQNITEKDVSKHLYTGNCSPLDLLIRTSGTHRLSDFLLWEIDEGTRTRIEFVPQLWPEYSPRHYFMSLMRWALWRYTVERDYLASKRDIYSAEGLEKAKAQ